MYGYMGYVLEVDLTESEAKKRRISEELLNKTVGGRGLGIQYLYNMLNPGIDPLSEENVIIFAVGPLCGTAAPSSGLISISTKSPLTGTCLSSHSGGFFGSKLKTSGYDALIITGAAKDPCYLFLDGDGAQIVSANSLWGMDTIETMRYFREKYGEVSVATIGQAGENVAFVSAIIMDGGRAAARGGPGAVMGSKKLKAIAVKGGVQSVAIAEKKLFESILKKSNILIVEKGAGLKKYGTAGVISRGNEVGFLPTRNFQKTYFKNAEEISAESLEKYKISDKACYACPISCSKIHHVDDCWTEGPEYETLVSWGSNCENSSIESIIHINDLCNRYGIDTISAGSTISFVMELYEKGIINKTDTDGINLAWGNSLAQRELIRKIAFREGFGDIIADGARKAAYRIGKYAECYAMHVKGLELPGYDPRALNGMALAYATSSRGGCHLRATIYVPEGFTGTLDRFTFNGKDEIVKKMQDDHALIDSLVMCKFTYRYGFESSPDKIAELIKAVTGWDVNGEWVLLRGERIYNLERLFNLKAGIHADQDSLPARFFDEEILDGPSKGRIINREAFLKCLKGYYSFRGWNEDGIPSTAKLKELEIEALQ